MFNGVFQTTDSSGQKRSARDVFTPICTANKNVKRFRWDYIPNVDALPPANIFDSDDDEDTSSDEDDDDFLRTRAPPSPPRKECRLSQMARLSASPPLRPAKGGPKPGQEDQEEDLRVVLFSNRTNDPRGLRRQQAVAGNAIYVGPHPGLNSPAVTPVSGPPKASYAFGGPTKSFWRPFETSTPTSPDKPDSNRAFGPKVPRHLLVEESENPADWSIPTPVPIQSFATQWLLGALQATTGVHAGLGYQTPMCLYKQYNYIMENRMRSPRPQPWLVSNSPRVPAPPSPPTPMHPPLPQGPPPPNPPLPSGSPVQVVPCTPPGCSVQSPPTPTSPPSPEGPPSSMPGTQGSPSRGSYPPVNPHVTLTNPPVSPPHQKSSPVDPMHFPVSSTSTDWSLCSSASQAYSPSMPPTPSSPSSPEGPLPNLPGSPSRGSYHPVNPHVKFTNPPVSPPHQKSSPVDPLYYPPVSSTSTDWSLCSQPYSPSMPPCSPSAPSYNPTTPPSNPTYPPYHPTEIASTQAIASPQGQRPAQSISGTPSTIINTPRPNPISTPRTTPKPIVRIPSIFDTPNSPILTPGFHTPPVTPPTLPEGRPLSRGPCLRASRIHVPATGMFPSPLAF